MQTWYRQLHEIRISLHAITERRPNRMAAGRTGEMCRIAGPPQLARRSIEPTIRSVNRATDQLEAGMIVDAYNTIWQAGGTSDYLTSEDFTADMMLSAMDDADVDMAVVCCLGQLTDNDYIEESCLRHPDRFVGFCQVDPRPLTAVETLKALAEKEAFRGVKLHPTMHGYHFADHGLLDPIFDLCASTGLAVLVNALDDPFCAPLSIEEIASGFPQVPVIIAHMGSVWNVMEAILVAKRRPNIYLETSSAELQSVRDAYRQVGPEQLIMGTDWPGSDFDLERAKIAKAIPDARHRELVEGANLTRILDLPQS